MFLRVQPKRGSYSLGSGLTLWKPCSSDTSAALNPLLRNYPFISLDFTLWKPCSSDTSAALINPPLKTLFAYPGISCYFGFLLLVWGCSSGVRDSYRTSER